MSKNANLARCAKGFRVSYAAGQDPMKEASDHLLRARAEWKAIVERDTDYPTDVLQAKIQRISACVRLAHHGLERFMEEVQRAVDD